MSEPPANASKPEMDPRVLQTIGSFAIAIFLSLCVRLSAKDSCLYYNINLFLWISSGLFTAAAIRFIDIIYDNCNNFTFFTMLTVTGASVTDYNTEKPNYCWLCNHINFPISLITFPTKWNIRTRSLLNLDTRFFDTTFVLFISGWISFVFAYFHIGSILFLQTPLQGISIWPIITLNLITKTMGCIIGITTLFAISKDAIWWR